VISADGARRFVEGATFRSLAEIDALEPLFAFDVDAGGHVLRATWGPRPAAEVIALDRRSLPRGGPEIVGLAVQGTRLWVVRRDSIRWLRLEERWLHRAAVELR
jgi:hypothetical protein